VRVFAVRASAGSFELFRVPANGGVLTPLTVTLPKTGPVGPGYFELGGTTDAAWGFECLPNGQVESWSAAFTHEGNGPYAIDQRIYALRGSELAQLSHRRSTIPQGNPAALPQSGGIAFGAPKVLCDSPLAAAP
jgi:hypothetical protein